MDISTYLLIAIAYIPLNVFDLYIISQYMNALYGFPPQRAIPKVGKNYICNRCFISLRSLYCFMGDCSNLQYSAPVL